jgi:hypothetical protein
MCQVVFHHRSVLFQLSVVVFVVALLSTVQLMAASVSDELLKKVDDVVNDIDEKGVITSPAESDVAMGSDNRIPTIVAEDPDSISMQTTSAEITATGEHAAQTSPPRARTGRVRTANSEGHKMAAPKYMLELYNKFSTDKYSHPMANIVRSFSNIISS